MQEVSTEVFIIQGDLTNLSYGGWLLTETRLEIQRQCRETACIALTCDSSTCLESTAQWRTMQEIRTEVYTVEQNSENLQWQMVEFGFDGILFTGWR